MTITRVVPGPLETLAADAAAVRARLLELYAPPARRWLRVNLVSSVSGNAVGSDGTSDSLTSRTDRTILGVIRELSDLVLVGAASVRAEGYQVPRRAPLAVMTSTGDFGGHRIAADQLHRVIVVCGASAADAARASLGDVRVIVVDDANGRLAPGAALLALRANGFESIVCEGGPSLAGQLVASDLVDEVCVTTSPTLNGGLLAPFGAKGFGAVPVSLAQLLHDDADYLYARWLVTR